MDTWEYRVVDKDGKVYAEGYTPNPAVAFAADRDYLNSPDRAAHIRRRQPFAVERRLKAAWEPVETKEKP